jgi:predicted Rossmann fold flavoprotein
VPIKPSLVPLETAGDVARKLNGLNLRNVTVKLLIDGRKRAEDFGELTFVDSGISGPTTLSLSGRAIDALNAGKDVSLSIDLKPALDDNKLDARILRDIDSLGKKQFRALLKGLLPSQLIPVCIDQTGISADTAAHQITSTQRRKLRLWLKDFRIEIRGHRPFSEAIITSGGVNTREIDPRTMESRLINGLYIVGEVLDVDADTGGYNLQSAFSTGWLAGKSAAEMR